MHRARRRRIGEVVHDARGRRPTAPRSRRSRASPTPTELHPVQAAFQEEHGLQCGFCTPGWSWPRSRCSTRSPSPTEREVRLGLEGNLCRCTGYHNIVRAVLAAAGDATGRVIPAPFDYVRPGSADEAVAAARRARRRRQAARRRDVAAAVDEAAARRPRPCSSTSGRLASSPTSATATTTSRSARSPGTAISRRATCSPTHCGAVAHGRGRGRRQPGAPPGHDRRLGRPRRPGIGPARRAARARCDVRRPRSRRRARPIAAGDFFRGFLETALEPDELLTEIRRAEGAWYRVLVPEVQAPRPGLGDRRGLAVRTATSGSRWSTWAERRCGRGRGGGARRWSVGASRPPSMPPRAPSHPATSTQRPSTASTSHACSCAAPSRPRRLDAAGRRDRRPRGRARVAPRRRRPQAARRVRAADRWRPGRWTPRPAVGSAPSCSSSATAAVRLLEPLRKASSSFARAGGRRGIAEIAASRARDVGAMGPGGGGRSRPRRPAAGRSGCVPPARRRVSGGRERGSGDVPRGAAQPGALGTEDVGAGAGARRRRGRAGADGRGDRRSRLHGHRQPGRRRYAR